MQRSAFIVVLLSLSGAVSGAAAQQLSDAPPPAQTVTVAAKIGGKSYQAIGSGSCRHAPDASIGGVSASVWMVQYAAAGDAKLKQLSLTLWRPKDEGPDQLSLTLETSSGSHRIETGQQPKDEGQGSVTILPSGPGGRLEINGKDAGGKSLQVTIDCPAFGAVEAKGE